MHSDYTDIKMYQPFETHCCHMGTAIKHPVPYRVKPSFVNFDIRALRRSGVNTTIWHWESTDERFQQIPYKLAVWLN